MIPRRGASILGAETVHLLERCREGDQVAWERLVHRYERLVSFVARSYGLTPEQSADLVAYMLRASNYPTGSADLAADQDALNAIPIGAP